MHELGITRNIVAIVAQAAHGRAVHKVTLEIGELAGVMADAIAFCFEVVARDTPLASASLEIVRVAGRARCKQCGTELETPTLFTACPCGSRDLQRLSGDELKIKTMEVEEAA
jgi:hydrogenase nickel incorporation protein HypA/HybF